MIDHLRIGAGAQIAAKSAVMGNLEAGRVYRGTPAVENHLFGRQQVGVRRLPKMIEQLRELSKRVEKLESATNDPERG